MIITTLFFWLFTQLQWPYTVYQMDGCPIGTHSDGLVYTTSIPMLDCYPGDPQTLQRPEPLKPVFLKAVIK